MTAIQSDAAKENIDVSKFLLPGESGALSEDDAAEAVLKTLLPPGKGKDATRPSSKKTETKKETTPSDDDADDETSAEELEDEDADVEDEETDEEKDEKDEDDEEAEAEITVKVKVGDETKEVPVSQLARLYGQESSLTKKSMEVATQRKDYETKLESQAAATNALLERAKKRWEPFSQLDFALLPTQVTAEEYTAIRQSAQAAYEDVQFLETGVQGLMKQIGDNRTTANAEQAKKAITTLSGPAKDGGIEGWSEKLYDDIRAHAISTGLPTDFVNSCVDAPTIRLMHTAMLFARGRDKSKVVTTKVNKRPKRIVKTSTNSESTRREDKQSGSKRAEARFKSSGSTDDAAELMLSRWKTEAED